MPEHMTVFQQLRELLMQYGHVPIIALLSWIAIALHKNGVKLTFDVRIWKNGKDRRDNH